MAKPETREETTAEGEGVLITGAIPAEEFALAETLSAIPGATFRCETVVECGDAVLPLLRTSGSPRHEIDEALRNDSSVTEATPLTGSGDEWLYRLSWTTSVRDAIGLLTADGAAILGLAAADGDWTVRVLFPSRSALGTTIDRCRDHGLSINVRSIKHVGEDMSDQYGLTSTQYDSLRLAYEHGYFDVPRSITLNELATEIHISHQAYSERLRRGTGRLVQQTLLNTVPSGQ